MRAGVIGLGKLGLVWAYVLRHHGGHEVFGYDLADYIPPQTQEPGMPDLLNRGHIMTVPTVAELLPRVDLVYVCVQTPHLPGYDGATPMPDDARDFDYRHLIAAVQSIADAAHGQGWKGTVVVMSTVLPGTCRRELLPLLPDGVGFVYSPAFISLGSIVKDFLHPRLIIAGSDDRFSAKMVTEMVEQWEFEASIYQMSIESAELLKVAHNTLISLRICYSNALAELADYLGADADRITKALGLPQPGLGDGGPCRPRDTIAMAWLADKAGLSADPFRWATHAREAQAQRLAFTVRQIADEHRLPIAILGRTYKPGVTYTDGSPAALLAHWLEHDWWWDPHTDPGPVPMPHNRPFVAVIATNHPEFREIALPRGSVVIDPWGQQPEREQVTLITPGRTRP